MRLFRHPDGHYAIRGPDEERRWVELWSAKRLSFDNKRAWEKQLVGDVAERLQLLGESAHHERGHRSWLRAVFASDDPVDCDAGNLTYLHVGTRPFSGLAHKFSFERWYGVPQEPCPIAWETPHRYYHRYWLDPSAAQNGEQARRSRSGTRYLCGSLTGDQAARELWLAMRGHPELIEVERRLDPWPELYGIRILMATPPGRLPAPVGILEAVVDGSIASFHCDSDRDHANLVAAKLSTQLRDTDASELLKALTEPGLVLFAGAPFRRHPTFVQLSPCDERCVFGSLEIAADSHLLRRTLSGEIFALEMLTEPT